MIAAVTTRLKREAERANERRVLVVTGDRDRGIDAAYDAIEAAGVDDDAVSIVSTREGFRFKRVGPRSTDRLLGQTRRVIVLDCHEQFVPNALGRTVGAVDGGGLLVLLTPPLDAWPRRRDRFDRSLAVPPYTLRDVTGRFRRRVVETLRAHPGIAIVALGGGTGIGAGADTQTDADIDTGTQTDADADIGTQTDADIGTQTDTNTPTLKQDGRTNPTTPPARSTPAPPPNARFPSAVYEACLTGDQARAVHAFEALATPGSAVVVEADRGRGKSVAAGLAAGALAREGADVLVTAPAARNAAALFTGARRVLDAPAEHDETVETLRSPGGGQVRFALPAAATARPADPDVVLVDEAAALPVRLLDQLLGAPSIGFCTTVHGYEGAGQGFAVRFRDRLAASAYATRDVRLETPIRYARDDPVESWAAHALLLTARAAVTPAVTADRGSDADGITPAETTYRALTPTALLTDETRLHEAFGLLVDAHYQTEPNDLARLLDAPNLLVRALTANDRVVAVALVAREGGLDVDTRTAMYEGARVRGNMVPDLLTSQLRDENAADHHALRTVRIAVHHALRGRGLGSRLLAEIHEEFDNEVAYTAVGFGVTQPLLRFWRRAGYGTIHLSTTRNDASGEHSAVMVRPTSAAGRALANRHAKAFVRRERDALSDAHQNVDPDVVRAALAGSDGSIPLSLTEQEWRAVVSAAVGPGGYEIAPGATRDLVLKALTDADPTVTNETDTPSLSARHERLLVQKVLQGRSWETVRADQEYASSRACMRALGAALAPLVERYGTAVARRERDRFDAD